MLGIPTAVARVLAVLLPALALVLSTLSAPAQAATGPALTLAGAPPAPRGSQIALVAALTDAQGRGVPGQPVRLESLSGGTWVAVTTAPTGADGTVRLPAALKATTRFRAVTEGGSPLTSPEVTVQAYDAETSLSLTGPGAPYVDSARRLRTVLTRAGGEPVAGETVRLQRRSGQEWRTVGSAVTGPDGAATYTWTVPTSTTVLRTTYAGRFDRQGTPDNLAGSASGPVTVTPLKRATVLTLTGPARVVDETSVPLRLRWRAGNGTPVPGSVVVQRRLAGGTWTRYATIALGADGAATFRVGPRVDSRWRAVGATGRWWQAAASAVKVLDNVPPGTPVAYPAAAPRPAVWLPRNARAVGGGPHATVSPISDATWGSMVGRTWHRGCPVGRSQLRVVRVNYWGYDGYRYRGEIVLRDTVAARGAALFASMYRQQLPIYRMYRVDRFGWSAYLHGGDDYRSMRAGNTSGFNCRGVTGNPSVTSPHSYGRSIDLNTWENPYRSKRGLVPNSWWQYHAHPRIAWRSRSHPVVQTMAAHGFRWTYGLGDTQHFDG